MIADMDKNVLRAAPLWSRPFTLSAGDIVSGKRRHIDQIAIR